MKAGQLNNGMKLNRLILALILLFSFSLSSCSTSVQLKTTLRGKDIPESGTVDEAHPLIGKTIEEIEGLCGINPLGDEAVSYGGFWFFSDKSGHPTIVRFSWEDKVAHVSEVSVFPKRFRKPSNKDFEKFENGDSMTVYEMVALFGVPNERSPRELSLSWIGYSSIEGDSYHFGYIGETVYIYKQ